MDKDLLIHRVGLVRLPDQNSCPSVLYYTKNGEPLAGTLAYEAAANQENIPDLNHDFKVALGNQSSRTLSSDLYPCADGQSRSAFKLTADFLRYCLKQAADRLSDSGNQDAAHLMIAEPVSVHGEDNGSWLTDYRKNLRDLLRDKEFTDIPNVHFQDVEFLPEPLAVFNFYRYGFRHPNLAGQEKYRVLVLDVGGGTSDCSVIETTKEGDISKSGKNSKPFGASSETIGGHYVNHKLAESLLLQAISPGKSKSELRKGLQRLLAYIRGKGNASHFNEQDWNLYSNLQWVLYYVESAKKDLSRFIADHPSGWSKVDPPNKEVFIQIPEDPFTPTNETEWKKIPLSASTFRTIFQTEIWKAHLRPLILRTLDNAALALDGKPINRIILSGGTANIGWIGHWVRTDIPALDGANLIDIKADYQEVVAQGLAIECSRRFFSEDHVSDFQSVTYNPLSIRIGVAGEAAKALDWKPLQDNLLGDDAGKFGTLIPAATDIKALCGRTLEWKLSSHTPKPRDLEYYFYATAGNHLPDDEDNAAEREIGRLNFEEFRLTAPSDAGFDSTLKLKLEIREDGTAIAQFLLRDGKHATAKEVLMARPFHIDMTSSRQETSVASKAYVGLDFGSSNTAMALVSALEIEQYEIDSKDKGWIELTDLSPRLPLPVAEPLARYIADSGDVMRRVKSARQTIETSLSLLVGVAMCDHQKLNGSKNGGAKHSPIMNFSTSKVSAGPLWTCLKDYMKLLGTRATLSSPIRDLLDEPSFGIINQAVTAVADCKHDKIDEAAVDWNRSLCIFGNVIRRIFDQIDFGYFSNFSRRAGKSMAQFRKLHGTGYGDSGRTTELEEIPEDGQPYLHCEKDSLFIPLFPWVMFENGADSSKRLCLFFDGQDKKGKLGYRSPTKPGEKLLQELGELSAYTGLAQQLLAGRLNSAIVKRLSISVE